MARDEVTRVWRAVGDELEDVAERAIGSLIQNERRRGVSYVYVGGEPPVLVMVAAGVKATRMLPIVEGLFKMAGEH